jgi:HPt (histidine-containing phosphotransfer) domain-containing protein
MRQEPRRPGAAPIDARVLAEHVEVLGFEETARIVATFEASVAEAPIEIERLAHRGERRALAELAHRLKSSSLHVGLTPLAEHAGALELAARGETTDLTASAKDLAAACRSGLTALRRAMARIAADQPANT